MLDGLSEIVNGLVTEIEHLLDLTIRTSVETRAVPLARGDACRAWDVGIHTETQRLRGGRRNPAF